MQNERLVARIPVMSEATDRIIREALQLDAEERAEVIRELLASLEGEPEPEASRSWSREIERRIESIRKGEAAGRPWSEVREDLERHEP